jgi:hypothetical protein
MGKRYTRAVQTQAPGLLPARSSLSAAVFFAIYGMPQPGIA